MIIVSWFTPRADNQYVLTVSLRMLSGRPLPLAGETDLDRPAVMVHFDSIFRNPRFTCRDPMLKSGRRSSYQVTVSLASRPSVSHGSHQMLTVLQKQPIARDGCTACWATKSLRSGHVVRWGPVSKDIGSMLPRYALRMT